MRKAASNNRSRARTAPRSRFLARLRCCAMLMLMLRGQDTHLLPVGVGVGSLPWQVKCIRFPRPRQKQSYCTEQTSPARHGKPNLPGYTEMIRPALQEMQPTRRTKHWRRKTRNGVFTAGAKLVAWGWRCRRGHCCFPLRSPAGTSRGAKRAQEARVVQGIAAHPLPAGGTSKNGFHHRFSLCARKNLFWLRPRHRPLSRELREAFCPKLMRVGHANCFVAPRSAVGGGGCT